MNKWYEVKVKYTKQTEEGTYKRVTEPYLLAAMTHSDAEARIYEELGSFVRGEFIVCGIKPANFHDVFHYEDSDLWFKVKVQYVGMDAESGKNKKASQNFLLSAASVKDAYDRIHESLSGMMVDFNTPTITESKIVDVFPYKESPVEFEDLP